MDYRTITMAADGSVGTITMNRPDVLNAFNDAMIGELTSGLRDLGGRPEIRVIRLRAAGKCFSAGADLNWMKTMADFSHEENVADAQALGVLMQTLNNLPKPTVAEVQGPAFGGGVGLVACCDIAIVADTATFALSEVRLGLIPAIISPYVVEAIGVRAARRYFLTGERFSAVEAHRLGLVHEMVPGHMLAAAVDRVVATLVDNGPSAQAAAKELIFGVMYRDPSTLVDETARRIADIRAGAEGREGISAFLEKRRPSWAPDEGAG